ncbi:MAG: iron chaperone, partial [bacterium]
MNQNSVREPGGKAMTMDGYFAALPPESQTALNKLRRDIHAAEPGAVEAIYYGMPAFRHRGKALVAFAAFKDHCSFFP